VLSPYQLTLVKHFGTRSACQTVFAASVRASKNKMEKVACALS
jgi:hypothetical protein